MSNILIMPKNNKDKDINNKPCLIIKDKRFFCKKREWYIKECPFETIYECDTFTAMCGVL